MESKDRIKLRGLANACVARLADPLKQSVIIFRGDMRAIVAANRELDRQAATIARQAKGL